MTFSVKRTGIILFLIFSISTLVFAAGNKEIPEIPPVTTGVQYISPNGDGIQEEATLEFSVVLFVKSKEGYVPEYGLEIIDDSGNAVAREVYNETRDIGWFASLFRGYDRFELTKTIDWDGKDQDGNLLADGVYKVKVWVTDANENRTEIDVDDFVIDTAPPEVSVAAENGMMFAPNGDGLLEDFPLALTGGTPEDLWEAAFIDQSGNKIKNITWTSGAPESFRWDGKDDAGNQAADGTYTFSISAEDRGGNTFESSFPGIILDSRAPVFRYEIENAVFSPNGDGKKDQAVVTLEYDETDDVKIWSYSLSSNNSVFATFSGEGTPPSRIILDGKDQDGNPLPQGVYKFAYSVEYENNWKPVIEDVVEIDSIPPRIGVSISNPIFSPNKDGLNDKTNISFKSSEEVVWTGSILDMNGNPVVETSSEQTTSLVVWDGTGPEGETIPDSDYLVMAKFTDMGGNEVFSEPVTLKVDNRPVGIRLSVPTGFSPNDDGRNDEAEIKIDPDLNEDIIRWTLKVLSDSGETVRTFTGTDSLPESVVWDGNKTILDDTDEAVGVPEGSYSSEITVEYAKGDVARAVSGDFLLDKTPPEIQFMVTADPFIKTDYGVEGNVFMSVQVDQSSPISGWNLDIMDENGNVLRAYSGTGDPSGDVAWNSSRDSSGLLNENMKSYTVRLAVTDAGGNTNIISEDLPIDILVVRRDGKLYLMVPNIIFGAYKYTLDSAGPSREIANRESLEKVVNIYNRYPDYDLELEGHALNIYLDGPREEREEEVLLPLTENRAKTVKAALVDMGMDEGSIFVKAFGGQNPIADVTDRTVWWKNRRVEFVMIEPRN